VRVDEAGEDRESTAVDDDRVGGGGDVMRELVIASGKQDSTLGNSQGTVGDRVESSLVRPATRGRPGTRDQLATVTDDEVSVWRR
jgi:hypothetical protein